jgi:hypothetical protein
VVLENDSRIGAIESERLDEAKWDSAGETASHPGRRIFQLALGPNKTEYQRVRSYDIMSSGTHSTQVRV